MFKYIDNILNRVTMYRLTLYYLMFLIFMAGIFSLFGLMPFTTKDLVISFFYLTTVCWIANTVLAKIYKVAANTESVYITAFILTLIISPYTTSENLKFMLQAGLIAMGVKYILAIRRKHIFNPAAFAVVATFFAINQGASWWVGNIWMLVPVALGGILVARKIKRVSMIASFLAVTIVINVVYALSNQVDVWFLLRALIISSPLIFFACVMMTEPQTSPTIRKWQIVYAIIVAALLMPGIHFGHYYVTPEIALVAANVFAYIVGPKEKLILTLQQKTLTSANVYDLVFKPDIKINFQPGQYLEWTLGHAKPDLRGNRRYFTIASSPTEDGIRLGVKVYENPSSFKQRLIAMKEGDKILAGQLAGDFTLPKDPNKKLIFMAGGVGITPFRSMLKYLIDKNEKRQIILFFSNRTADEIIYRDALDEAAEKLGIKTVYILTGDAPADWDGERGRLDPQMIVKNVADYKNYEFYISGSHQVVTSFETLLRSMGIAKKHIKTDFFPGFV